MHTRHLPLALLLYSCLVAPIANGKPLVIGAKSFRCVTQLTKVGDFYVDNLAGNLKGTVKVARSRAGGVFPVGSVVQLVPTEVMVKRERGFNAATRDWEFFELDIGAEGTKIRTRGFAEVNNRFGGNCFSCHVKARPEWDFVCGADHGCDPIPITRDMFGALQRTDPRCHSGEPIAPADAAALRQLAEIVKAKMPAPQ